jgi:hypothetical protein
MTWKECGRKRLCPSLQYFPIICLDMLRKTMKYLSQDNQCPSQDSNWAPPKCKSQALLLEPTCSDQQRDITPVMSYGKLWLRTESGFLTLSFFSTEGKFLENIYNNKHIFNCYYSNTKLAKAQHFTVMTKTAHVRKCYYYSCKKWDGTQLAMLLLCKE